MTDIATKAAALVHVLLSRRQLARMDDRMLSDIGVSRADALAEAGRAPWDASPYMPLRSRPYLRTVNGCDLRRSRCGAG